MNEHSCDIINYFIESRKYTKYLEIGIFKGEVIENVICENKMGVDPSPICSKETLDKYIIKTTSENFFELLDDNDKFDIIFIDGIGYKGNVLVGFSESFNFGDGVDVILHKDIMKG